MKCVVLRHAFGVSLVGQVGNGWGRGDVWCGVCGVVEWGGGVNWQAGGCVLGMGGW